MAATRTAKNCDEAGLKYDFTLGFPELIGFRCGTCFRYNMFDAKSVRVENQAVPLLVMDTLLHDQYMGLGTTESLSRVEEVVETCSKLGGTFTILWHNSNLASKPLRNIYENIINACAKNLQT